MSVPKKCFNPLHLRNRWFIRLLLLMVVPGTAFAATPVSVNIPNANFEDKDLTWSQSGASLTIRDIPFNGATQRMGCFKNPSTTALDGASPGNSIEVKFGPLKANTQYRFSFLALTSGTTNNKLIDVRSTVREANDATSSYRARPYTEQMRPANGLQSFTFKTPLKDIRAGNLLKENGELLSANSSIFFMAKPETQNDSGLGGELCIDSVRLEIVVPDATDPRLVTAVQVNQTGYGIGSERRAIIANASLGDTWALTENGKEVLTGTVNSPGTLDTDSGDMIVIADFSTVKANPNAIYAIKLVHTIYIGPLPYSMWINSAPFKINTKQYSELKVDALSFFYAQHSTEDINMLKYPRYRASVLTDRPAGHNTDLAKCWAVSDKPWGQNADGWGNKFWNGCSWPSDTDVPGIKNLVSNPLDSSNEKSLDVSGGWYDAADHGKYVVNGGVALWILQNQIERLQKRGASALDTAIPDGRLMYPLEPAWIPTRGKIPQVKLDKTSDLMNEARYEMEWMLKMQVPGLTAAEVLKGNRNATASTWMSLPVGYQSSKTIDNAFELGAGRKDESSGITWPALGVKLASTPNINVSGMAFHAIHDRYWTGVPQYAHGYDLYKPGTTEKVDASEKRVLMYPTTAATLNLAATAAQCYRIWKNTDAEFAKTCLIAAGRAFDAAKANSKVFRIEFSDKRNLPFQAQFPGGGAYGDYRVKDEFYWAAIELYLAYALRNDTTANDATTAASYLTEAQNRIKGGDVDGSGSSASLTTPVYVPCEEPKGVSNSYPIGCYNWVSAFDWQNTAALGTISLATTRINGFSDQKTVDDNIKAIANTYLTQRSSQGYLFPKAVTELDTNKDGPLTDYKNDYKWGSNSAILNRALVLGVAYDITTDSVVKETYLQGAADAMHYILGRNALGKSYVSGYGTNPLQNPHHRFWGKTGNVEYPSVMPGVLSGGPAAGEFTGMFIGGSNEGGDHFWYKTRNLLGCKELTNGKETMVVPKNTNLLTSMKLSTTLQKVNRYNGQRCYSDDIRSFATNEVAVNWNAPLFWVTQFLDGAANSQ